MPIEILLDVQTLAAPEPLEQAIQSLQRIKAGSYIRMIHRKEPCLLFPILEEKGYYHKQIKSTTDIFIIFICLKNDTGVQFFLEQLI